MEKGNGEEEGREEKETCGCKELKPPAVNYCGGPEIMMRFPWPDGRSEFTLAFHGADWYCALWDLDQKLRGWLRHGHEHDDADGALQAARDELWRIMDDRGVNFDMVS